MADQYASKTSRHSHGLSLSPYDVTRDSLVNNMLLSLDQFSLEQKAASTGTSRDRPPNAFDDSARPWIHDAIGKSSSSSSSSSSSAASSSSSSKHGARSNALKPPEYRAHLDAAPAPADLDSHHPSLLVPRARRSESHSVLRFLGSSDDPSAAGTARAAQSRGRDTSQKTLSSTHPDPASPGPSSLEDRAGRHALRRSLSLDHISSQGFSHEFPESLLSPLPSERRALAAPFIDDDHENNDRYDSSDYGDYGDDGDDGDYGGADYEAAPSPTVPGGSRRAQSDLQNPFPSLEPPEFPARTRERSTSRSRKSSSGPSKRGARLHSAAPAMPTCDLDAAPAPSVGYGKTKAEQAAFCTTTPTSNPQAKERQGFFRRVFGSRGSTPHGMPEAAQPANRSVSSTLHQTSAGSRTMAPAASPREVSSSHSNHHTLQKRPSSFFRRYIMGTSEDAPPLPSDSPVTASSDGGVDLDSALALDPYLHEASDVAAHGAFGSAVKAKDALDSNIDGDERREFQRDFSPEYEPSLNAKIRAVTSDSDHEPLFWSPESPTSPRPRPSVSSSHKKRSNSFLDVGSGSDNGDFRMPMEFMHAGGRHDSSSDAADAAGLSTTAKGGRDSAATIRQDKKHTYRMNNGEFDDEATRLKLIIPRDRSTSFESDSTETDYKSASSRPSSVRIEVTGNFSPQIMEALELAQASTLDEPEIVVGEPTEDDRMKAQQIYDGVEDFIPKEKAAAWMGEEGLIRQRTLQAYMELFDFAETSVVTALRKVCSRLILRAETQQVDRILVAFSQQWCNCNPNHGFKSMDVIHTICYSIMLLNTDLHVADIDQKMTRSQFVKNTIGTIMQAVAESTPDSFERPSILPEKGQFLSGGAEPSRPPTESDKKSFRTSFRPSPRVDTFSAEIYDECGPLVKAPFYGNLKVWEELVETSLKMAYTSIRDECLPLFGADPDKAAAASPAMQGSLSVMGMLKRSPSVLSKAPSESFMSTRGRPADGGLNSSARWTSKNRSRPGLTRPGFSSSRTSFDDGSSAWSPSMSSATWSRYSLGRTHGSASQDSFGSAMTRGDYQQSIGFANALSQAIFRDEDAAHDALSAMMSLDVAPSLPMLEDESLELLGPPWIKEGRVMHKHHLDGTGKRARDRNWSEVFAVVQKGQISLFSFQTSKSVRQKTRGRSAAKLDGPVGGGNWQDNAVNLFTFNLRLTLASALPSPGYSRSRPFVWALSLPTGAVHLFQVGTPEIIREFVDTANYWSARLSSHPFTGGISNMEYGWGEGVVSNSLVAAVNESSAASISSGKTSRPNSSATHTRKSSVQSSISLMTTSMDQGSSTLTHNSGRGKMPGDRILISDWTPPTQSMRPSNLLEAEQHSALAAYVKSLEGELQTHNELRSPMLLAYSPRSQNATKAMTNWERKSSYLLRETVKFRTYVDALAQASSRRREIYKERDLAWRAARGELTDADMELSGEEDGDETLRP